MIFPVKWSAPEFFDESKQITSKSDVWSYGIVLYEIFTYGSSPYEGMNNEQVIKKILEGYRLPIPSLCPTRIALLLKKCWEFDPNLRPIFEVIYEEIKQELISQGESEIFSFTTKDKTNSELMYNNVEDN